MRRIIRRAIRYAHQINKNGGCWLYKLAESVAKTMGQAYPEIVKNQQQIQAVIEQEETLFLKTLDKGMEILNEVIGRMEGLKKVEN